MSEYIYLVELTGYDTTVSAVVTKYYSTGVGYVTSPSETPANTTFDPRVIQPALLSRNLFGGGRTSGKTQLTYGEIVLANKDGDLDTLLNLGLDGRTVTIRRGLSDAAYPSGFTTVLVGIVEQIDCSVDTITVRLRAADFKTDIPFQTSKYGGTNVLPAGVDGVEGDLKRKPKPILYGSVTNISPPCVNTAENIYQVNDGAVNAISAVYDQGTALVAGVARASQATLEANIPAAGQFDTWLGGGMFRLGSDPVGPVTCDSAEAASAALRYPAQIADRVLKNRLGFTAPQVSSADVTALDLAAPYECGFWWDEETTGTDVLDAVLTSAGASWGPDLSGVMRMKQFVAATGTPAYAFVATDIIGNVYRSPTADQDRGVPVWSVIVRYAKNYTVQTSGVAAGVTEARRGVIAQEWRDARYTDATVQTKHLLAAEIIVETGIVSAANALTEATRLQVLRGTRRDRFEFVVTQDVDTVALDLNNVVSITHPRYGLATGASARLIGIEPDARAKTLRLTGWV